MCEDSAVLCLGQGTPSISCAEEVGEKMCGTGYWWERGTPLWMGVDVAGVVVT